MNMAEKNGKKKSKKNNRPASIPPRNKQSHAQYVWIKHMFLRQDELDARITAIEEFLGGRENIEQFRKTYKQEKPKN